MFGNWDVVIPKRSQQSVTGRYLHSTTQRLGDRWLKAEASWQNTHTKKQKKLQNPSKNTSKSLKIPQMLQRSSESKTKQTHRCDASRTAKQLLGRPEILVCCSFVRSLEVLLQTVVSGLSFGKVWCLQAVLMAVYIYIFIYSVCLFIWMFFCLFPQA